MLNHLKRSVAWRPDRTRHESPSAHSPLRLPQIYGGYPLSIGLRVLAKIRVYTLDCFVLKDARRARAGCRIFNWGFDEGLKNAAACTLHRRRDRNHDCLDHCDDQRLSPVGNTSNPGKADRCLTSLVPSFFIAIAPQVVSVRTLGRLLLRRLGDRCLIVIDRYHRRSEVSSASFAIAGRR